GDGRGVELGERAPQPPAARGERRGVPGGQGRGDGITRIRVGARGDRVEVVGGVAQPAADALAELAGGGAGEGHHQQLVGGDRSVGERAGDEPGDGPGLAGAGGRLHQGGAVGEGGGDVQLGGLEGCGHGLALLVSSAQWLSSGSQTLRASEPNQVGSVPAGSSSGVGTARTASNGTTPPWTSWWACRSASPCRARCQRSAAAAAAASGSWPSARARA